MSVMMRNGLQYAGVPDERLDNLEEIVGDGQQSVGSDLTDAVTQLNSSLTNIATNIQNATIPSGYTGTCQYIKLGRIVILAGTVNSANAISAFSAFVTGLPTPLVSNPTIRVLNNNAVNSIYDCVVQGGGAIAPVVQTASNVSLRITGVYISAN